ncbi:MAG: hypothetical protein ERJ67_05470 [Aphanocapsa feldmannii 277cV]|uniref:Uncharacterized protein n=2 Tax=Aphanocapsa feldmannii TaxID=192050 RepID=A0A524RNM6_9CHRO|nr:MAG: hypothetical protein ERJ67_05470 [Aphanocapsa feldmannii 277cV]TGH24578.1 MAG: hypothetical protein ERJ68_03080 [Aphanocapsa feldmannii 277cI]
MDSALAMARFEVLLSLSLDVSAAADKAWRGRCRALIVEVAQQLAASLNWIDERNAALSICNVDGSFTVNVLVELREWKELGLLISSTEPMTMGSPMTQGILTQVIDVIERREQGAHVVFRSDHHGPVRHEPGGGKRQGSPLPNAG